MKLLYYFRNRLLSQKSKFWQFFLLLFFIFYFYLFVGKINVKCEEGYIMITTQGYTVNSMFSTVEKSSIVGFGEDSEEKPYSLAGKLLDIISMDSKRQNPAFKRVNTEYIEKLAREIETKPKQNRILLITGKSGSGKTTITDLIKNLTGSNTSVLSMDNYYKHTADKGTVEELLHHGYSFDVPESVNLEQANADLKKLLSGQEVRIPGYSFCTGASTPNAIPVESKKLIIMDGIFAHNPLLVDGIDAIKIFVDTPNKIIEDRWFPRAIKRGKTKDEAKTLYVDVTDKAREHIEPYMDKSSIVINGNAEYKDIESIIKELFDAISKHVHTEFLENLFL